MEKRVGEWLKRHGWLVLFGLFFIALLLALGLHYWFNANKNFWDFLESLVIPSSLAAFATFLQWLQKRQEDYRREAQQEHDESQAKEDALEDYFSSMIQLLNNFQDVINKTFTVDRQATSLSAIFRARTLSILRRLSKKDGDRKASVVQFLTGISIFKDNLNLGSADLSYANLSEIGLDSVNLENANFRFADLSGAVLTRANLARAILSGANLAKANLSESDLSNADLASACLADADLSSAKLKNACLISSDISRSNLINANLRGSNLEKADLKGADLSSAELTDAHLLEANLEGAVLRGATLNETNLSSSILRRANLVGADLSGASLMNADLYKANLRNTNLRDTELQDISLSDISFSPGTKWPAPEEVAKARNIPPELKKQLGLDDPQPPA